MIIGINEKYQIKQIHNITDSTLTVIEIDENSEYYPFKDWTEERIKCYCYKQDNQGICIYPYVDTRKIDEIEQQTLALQAQVIDLEFEKILGGMM